MIDLLRWIIFIIEWGFTYLLKLRILGLVMCVIKILAAISLPKLSLIRILSISSINSHLFVICIVMFIYNAVQLKSSLKLREGRSSD